MLPDGRPELVPKGRNSLFKESAGPQRQVGEDEKTYALYIYRWFGGGVVGIWLKIGDLGKFVEFFGVTLTRPSELDKRGCRLSLAAMT